MFVYIIPTKTNELSHLARIKLRKALHRCFPVNFTKFVKAPFLRNSSGQLLLKTFFLSFIIETVVPMCSLKNLFLKIHENSPLS